MNNKHSKIEVLAPCGDYDILIAAVHAGADACYIGGNSFGARAYATNFDEETIKQAVTYAHLHGVKVYLTVLFCVALLLLLISFVMQQRNHLALQDLNDSISNTQEIADLQLENQRLQYELEDKQALEEQVQAQQKQVEALEWLRQIEAATRTSYTRARELVEAFEETGLESSLPTESVVEGADSPADTYRSIYAMLF